MWKVKWPKNRHWFDTTKAINNTHHTSELFITKYVLFICLLHSLYENSFVVCIIRYVFTRVIGKLLKLTSVRKPIKQIPNSRD